MIMQSAKRRTDNEDKSPFTLSFRFSKDLVHKIINGWEKEGFANRTALVEAACNLYFDTFECPRCKNRNHVNSLYCSICGNAFTPAYELKKELKIEYQELLERQEKVLFAESEVEKAREKCYEMIHSSNLEEDVIISLEELLAEVPTDYWFSTIIESLELGNLGDALKFKPPYDLQEYAFTLSEVQEFFKSPTYLKDTPILTEDKAKEVVINIGNLMDFQTHYEIMLKRSMSICLKITNLIDKLN